MNKHVTMWVAMWLSFGALLVSTTARANFFTDTIDAIRGHVDDVNSRLNHDEEFIDGNTITANMFRTDDSGRDSVHWANGSASLVEQAGAHYLQLHSDFNTGPAPDLYVYIADRKVFDESSFWAAQPAELAKLTSGSGAQFYELPEVGDHIEVIIWCKRFGAFIGATTLNGSQG